MSVVLQTGVMYYRENQSDDWHPLILKADADLSSFIEEYSQRAWELGEYCRYHNVIYRCTTAITTPETWNSSHWTATDVGEELKSFGIIAKKTLAGKRAYIIGDSLNSRNGGFGQHVLSISGMVGQSIGNGASGFVQQGLENKVFADVLADLVSSLTADEKNTTDYLIVLGGINDALNNITATNEKNAVVSFITSAKVAFPNAEIIICPLHTFKWLSRTQYNCYAAIMDASSENGVRTTEDFMWWTIVDDYGINNGDDVHITSAGCQILGGLVVNYLLGGDVLRTWAYSVASSIGTIFSNSLTRRGRDFFWRAVVTSLNTATPADLNNSSIVTCSNQSIKNAVWTSGALFINGFIYLGTGVTSYPLRPVGVGIAKTTDGITANCYVIDPSAFPQNISGVSAWIVGEWKAGIDEHPNS